MILLSPSPRCWYYRCASACLTTYPFALAEKVLKMLLYSFCMPAEINCLELDDLNQLSTGLKSRCRKGYVSSLGRISLGSSPSFQKRLDCEAPDYFPPSSKPAGMGWKFFLISSISVISSAPLFSPSFPPSLSLPPFLFLPPPLFLTGSAVAQMILNS